MPTQKLCYFGLSTLIYTNLYFQSYSYIYTEVKPPHMATLQREELIERLGGNEASVWGGGGGWGFPEYLLYHISFNETETKQKQRLMMCDTDQVFVT